MSKRLAQLPRYIIFLPLILFVILLYGGILQRFVPALSVGESKYSAAQFNYWYYESYLNYVDEHYDELDELGLDTNTALDKQQRESGQTWEDYFRVQAESKLQEVETLLSLADDYGVSLRADDLPEYAQRLADAEAECEESGIDLEDYVRSYYGYSVTVANYKKQLLRDVGADAVRKAIEDSLTPTEEDAVAYAAEHPDLEDYTTANIRVIWFSASTDRFTGEVGETQLSDMQSKVDLLLERWNQNGGDEAAFGEMAERYSEHESAASGGSLTGVEKGQLTDSLDTWLFDEERQAGDYTTSVTSDGVWVIYYCGAGDSKAVLTAKQLLLEQRTEDYLAPLEQNFSVKERFGMQIAM
jgi:hypothetical protein